MKFWAKLGMYQKSLFVFAGMFAMCFLYFNTMLVTKTNRTGVGQDDFWNQTTLLYDTHYQEKNWNLNEFIFGVSTRNRQFYNQFLSIQSQYEYQKNYGLIDSYNEQIYYMQLTSLSESTLSLVQRHQAQMIQSQLADSARRMYHDNPDYSFLKTPAAVIGVLGAFYTGKMIRFRVADGWSIQTRSGGMGSSGVGLLGISGKGFSASFEKSGSDNRHHLLITQQLGSHTSTRAIHNASRGSTTLGVTQALGSNVSVSYDRDLAAQDARQETVQLNYSAGF